MTITHVDRNLYRGPRPNSFKDLIEYNIKHVINLESGVHEFLTDSIYENEDAANFGMIEYNLNCNGIIPPTHKSITKSLSICDNTYMQNQNVFVHCLHGKDRTGYMCAVYRMKINVWSYKKAVEEMFSFGFHKLYYGWWLLPLYNYYQRNINSDG